MQGVRIWLPNIEGFFTSLGRLLESAEGQRNTASYDSAEFFSRRLRKNERTLFTDSKNRQTKIETKIRHDTICPLILSREFWFCLLLQIAQIGTYEPIFS